MGIRVVRTILKNLWLLILFPVIMAFTVFYLTRKEVKIYDSKMTIYTGISATKVGIGDAVKLDFFTANNAMDNLIAIFKGRNTIQEASLKLMAIHLSLPKDNKLIINYDSYAELKRLIPDTLWRKVSVLNNPDATLLNIRTYMSKVPNSKFEKLLEGHRHYGIDQILEKIKATRRASSDMIDITFESDDAGICSGTLKLLAEAYFLRYREMKRAQNASAVEYFERQLKDAFLKLQDSEERLKQFITKNKILNFYEQGKSLAIYEKEEEQEEQDVRQLATGADVTLKKIEKKLAANVNRSRTVDSLASLRDQVNNVRFRINAMLLDKPSFTKEIAEARVQMQDLYARISEKVAALYQEDYSIEGIPSAQILGEWLNLYMEKEKQLTYLEQVVASKNMVSRRIEDFAPLGAGLKKLEREVSVNESQYLSILHGLNMANLQRQSMEEASMQELIDEPFYPRSPRGSKRMMLVVASALVGVVLVIATIIARIVFDATLQNAVIAAQKTGLKVPAAFPQFHSKKLNKRNEATRNMVANQLANEILVAAEHHAYSEKHSKILFYQSLQSDDAPSLQGIVTEKLKQLKLQTDSFCIGKSEIKGVQSFEGASDSIAKLNWEQIIAEAPDNPNGFILVGLPALKNQPFPVHLFSEADIVIASANAARQWKLFDDQLLQLVEQSRDEKPWLVLNNVHTDNLKDFFGQIPIRNFLGRNRSIYK